MLGERDEKTFLGFWPASDEYCGLESLALDENGFNSEATRKNLVNTLLEVETDDWHIVISNDYMCLIHLKYLEEDLNRERVHNSTCELYELSLGITRQVKSQYIEALNALYFLIFSSCFTGRGNYFLHDFSEVTIWQCLRVMYSSDNKPLRRIQFGRGTKKESSRSGAFKESKVDHFLKIESEIFKDAIHYWEIIVNQELIQLCSVGTKIISEHRLESYDLSVVLSWFELESWIMSSAHRLGVQTSRPKAGGTTYHFSIKDIINRFSDGTTIANLAEELHDIREIRNSVAHYNAVPSHDQSTKSIKLFMKMLNIRSGLNLSVDLHRTPLGGM